MLTRPERTSRLRLFHSTHEKFLPRLLALGEAEFMGMKELATR